MCDGSREMHNERYLLGDGTGCVGAGVPWRLGS